MLRSIAIAIAIVLAFGVASSFANAADKFTSKDGRYSVEFPAPPKETTKDVDASPTVANDGKLKMFYAALDVKKDVSFMVIYNDFKEAVAMASPQKVLIEVRDGSKGKEGMLVTDREIVAADGKPPGREYIVDKGIYYRSRTFLSGNRLYQIVVVAKSDKEVTSEAADKFIDSFEIAK